MISNFFRLQNIEICGSDYKYKISISKEMTKVDHKEHKCARNGADVDHGNQNGPKMDQIEPKVDPNVPKLDQELDQKWTKIAPK